MKAAVGVFVVVLIGAIIWVVIGSARSSDEPPVAGAAPGAVGTPAGVPAEPPARICGDQDMLGGGPTAAPEGAVVVPAGDNTSMGYEFRKPNTTFWFAPGVHTLGTDQFGQILPGDGSTYVGAPGAVIDGQRLNQYAFVGDATRVTIRYLTIRNFVAPMNEGTVNHGFGSGWLVEYSTIANNAGAGLMAGGADNTYRFNCVKDNGQYGVSACCGTAEAPVKNLVLDHNEIVGNNTDDWEKKVDGCGCTGGVKFWINQDGAVTNNWVHDNRGVGLWLDNNNSGFTIHNNYIEGNDSYGLMMEAGYDASVRYNYFGRNAIVTGREFQQRNDGFPIGAIYVSEDGSPQGYGLKYTPTVISDNKFENNWGGVIMWESADRYCASSAHTHPPFCTIKVNLYDDAQCKTAEKDVIPPSIGDKYRCKWSTENNVVENNVFVIDKKQIGDGCVGGDQCGVSGLFGGYGTLSGFPGYDVMWRVTFEQGNVFRNNQYVGDWRFAGFNPTIRGGGRVTWRDWTAPAPPIPAQFTDNNWPTTFGQDQGSSYNNS